MQTIYSYLSDNPTSEINLLKRAAENKRPSDGTFNPEHFLAQVIDQIEKRKTEEAETFSRTSAARKPQTIQDQASFTRDANFPSHSLEKVPSANAGKPTIKGERSEGQPEEVDALEKELEKAEQLKQRGLISEEEYQALRKKALGL